MVDVATALGRRADYDGPGASTQRGGYRNSLPEFRRCAVRRDALSLSDEDLEFSYRSSAY
jgi:hypothetical protein